MKWINANDKSKLIKGSNYLLYVKYSTGCEVRTGEWFFDGEKSFFLIDEDGRINNKVTHWMNVPKPPTS
jgi:hypothetical protein